VSEAVGGPECGHDPPIPWQFSSCLACVFWQAHRLQREAEEAAAAILDAVRYMPGAELNKWVARHHRAYQRADDARRVAQASREGL